MEIAIALCELPALQCRLQGCVAPEQPGGDCIAGWGCCSGACRCAAQEREQLFYPWGEAPLPSAHTTASVPGQSHPQANGNTGQGCHEVTTGVVSPAHGGRGYFCLHTGVAGQCRGRSCIHASCPLYLRDED